MSESNATAVYLVIAAMHLSVAGWKALALLRAPSLAFALQTTTHAVGGTVYVVASPLGYRAVGSAFGQPWLPTLPIYLGILACFATNHLLTVLWTTSGPDQPRQVRRSITTWVCAYCVSLATMVALFLDADLDGPADPLKFNTEQVGDPHVLIFLTVFLTMLSCGTLSVWLRSRRARINDEAIMHAVRWFGISMLVTFGYVVCSAPAIAAAAMGHHQLDGVGVLGSAFGVVGSVMTCYGVSGAAVSTWLGERRDIAVLQPLWDLVVAGVDEELSLGSTRGRPGTGDGGASHGAIRTRPNRFVNVRWTLHRRVIEILDGIRELERRSWVRDSPAQAVMELHDAALKVDALRGQLGLGKKGLASPELEAAATAAVLRDAAERLQTAREMGHYSNDTTPAARVGSAPVAPGKKTPAGKERRRLVRVARALHQPLVNLSLEAVQSVHAAEGDRQVSAGAR